MVKMSVDEDQSAKVTLSYMTLLSENQPIQLPHEFYTALKGDGENFAVIILAPNTKIIRVIPTKSDTVAKININIGKLSPDFLRQMGSIFIAQGIKTLYSTGLCFTQNTCVYEGFFDTIELEGVSLEDIKKEFEEIPGVSTVTVEELKATKLE